MTASTGWIICTSRGSVMPSMCAKTRRHAIGKWERAFGKQWSQRTRGRRIGWRCVRVSSTTRSDDAQP